MLSGPFIKFEWCECFISCYSIKTNNKVVNFKSESRKYWIWLNSYKLN